MNDYNPFLDTEKMKKVDLVFRKTKCTLESAVVRLPLEKQITLIESIGYKGKKIVNENDVFRAIEVIATIRARKEI